MINLRPATEQDVIYLENVLNDEFDKGLNDAHDRFMHRPLIEAVQASCQALVITDDDKPVVMFGVVNNPENNGQDCLWLKNSIKIKEHYKSILLLMRKIIKKMLNVHPVLFNCIDKKHKSMIRAVEFCGAEIRQIDENRVLYTLRRINHV